MFVGSTCETLVALMPFIQTKFPVGTEPKFLTSISQECSERRCEDYTGIFERDENPEHLIFCIHACDKKQNQVM